MSAKGIWLGPFIERISSKKLNTWRSRQTVKKIDSLGVVSRLLGSGRPRSVRTDEDIQLVNDLVLSQEDKPQTHRTQREIVRETGISRSSVQRIKKELGLKCLKKTRAHELTWLIRLRD